MSPDRVFTPRACAPARLLSDSPDSPPPVSGPVIPTHDLRPTSQCQIFLAAPLLCSQLGFCFQRLGLYLSRFPVKAESPICSCIHGRLPPERQTARCYIYERIQINVARSLCQFLKQQMGHIFILLIYSNCTLKIKHLSYCRVGIFKLKKF